MWLMKPVLPEALRALTRRSEDLRAGHNEPGRRPGLHAARTQVRIVV